MKTIFFMFFILLYGCASQPVKIEDASRVSLKPSSRYAKKSDVKNASIAIVIDSNDTFCNVDISVNSHFVVKLQPSTYANLYVKPGRYYVGAKYSCTGHFTEEDINIRNEDKLQFRVQIGGEKPISILPVK
jgi:hypothetical protein